MLFVIDEDVNVAVGAVLSSSHDVRYVADVLGQGTPDRDVVAYARATEGILVTADWRLARPLRGSHRCRCLILRGLGIKETARVTELLSDIEREATRLGEKFWMQIGADMYVVSR